MLSSERKNRSRGAALLTALSFGAACSAPLRSWADSGGIEMHGPSGDSKTAVQLSSEEVRFQPVAGKQGVYSANVVGNPSAPGIYVVFVKMDKGASNAPHTHPDGRATTVISGKVRYGLGDQVVLSSSKIYGPGSFYYTPPNTPHYLVATEGEVVYEEVGMGPSASVPVAAK